MTTIKVDTITNAAGSGAPNIPDGVTIGGTALASLTNTMDYTASATEPTSPNNGAIWWDTGNDKLFQYMNGSWIEVVYTTPPIPFIGSRGLFNGGNASAQTDIIDYVTIPTAGNATDFGNLAQTSFSASALSNRTTAVVKSAGLDYYTIATLGNASDFGNTLNGGAPDSACCNGVYGVFTGRNNTGLDYITVATPADATDFGDLTGLTKYGGAAASKFYGLISHGFDLGTTVDYISMDTPSNATVWGDLVEGDKGGPGFSDNTYAYFASGRTSRNVERFSFATQGNATDFGTLTYSFSLRHAASCDPSTAVIGGGTGEPRNTIHKFTLATGGSSTDFGDLTVARYDLGGCSGD